MQQKSVKDLSLKIVAILLAVVLSITIAGLVDIPAFASPAYEASVSVSSPSSAVGSYVDVVVSLDTNSAGLSTITLNLGYDVAVLERVSITAADLLPISTLPPDGANPFNLVFIDLADALKVVEATGELATIRFRVLDDAALGPTPLSLSVIHAYRTYNLAPVTVNASASGSYITVTPAPESITVTAAANATTVRRGSSLQFSATVSPPEASQAVEWSVTDAAGNPVSGVSITSTGLLNVAANVPLNTQLTITATATGTTVSGTATVTVIAAATGGSGGGGGGTGGGGGGQTQQPPVVPPTVVIPDLGVPLGPFISEHIVYITGFPDGSFRPGQSITRAEVAMILFRLVADDAKDAPQTNRFADITTGSWYAQAINYLAGQDILTGYPDGSFRPNTVISRAELTAVMSRFFELRAASGNAFSDIAANHWALAYINNAYARGWILGYQDGTFRPNHPISRAEAVTLTNRVLERIPNPATIDEHLAETVIFNDVTPAHWAYHQIMEAAIEHDFEFDDAGHEIWKNVVLPPS